MTIETRPHPSRLRAFVAAAAIVAALAAVVGAGASVVAAHNTRAVCAEVVTEWPGQPSPCL